MGQALQVSRSVVGPACRAGPGSANSPASSLSLLTTPNANGVLVAASRSRLPGGTYAIAAVIAIPHHTASAASTPTLPAYAAPTATRLITNSKVLNE